MKLGQILCKLRSPSGAAAKSRLKDDNKVTN